MHTPARRRGRRADVDTLRGCLVGVEAGDRPRVKLEEILHAAVDVAADVVGIIRLHRRRPKRTAGQDAVAEAWGKALDLSLDRRGHIYIRAVRHMAVSPGGMLAGRRTA